MPRRIAFAALALVLAATTAALAGARWPADGRQLPDGARKVVIFGMPNLGFGDLRRGVTPTLDGIAAAGAVGAMTVRAHTRRPEAPEGYATLGAGARLKTAPQAALAFGRDERERGASTGRRHTGAAVAVPGGAAIARANEDRHVASDPGALGRALHAAGKATAVVGNGDVPAPTGGAWRVSRPAALALMGSGFTVDAGAVGRDLLARDPIAAGAHSADPGRMLAAARAALRSAAVLVVDPGDLDRAGALAAHQPPRRAAIQRDHALARTDAILGLLVAELSPDTLLLVVAPALAPQASLAPAIVAGAGVPHGWLDSPSTKRRGIVTITDVAPTVLRALGAPVPAAMVGHALTWEPGEPDFGYFARIDRDSGQQARLYRPIVTGYVIAQAAVLMLAALALARTGAMSSLPGLGVALLAITTLPLASLLVRLVPGLGASDAAAVVALLAVMAAITALAGRARRDALHPLMIVFALTSGVLLLDVCIGGPLHISGLLGYSLQGGGRFYGFPNTTFAALAATSLLLVTLLVHRAADRGLAIVIGAALLAIVTFVDAMPTLGSDVGGALAIAPVYAVAVWLLAGRRMSWRVVAAGAGATVVILALVAGIDLLRDPADRTHLGTFAADVGDDGAGVLFETLARKASANLGFVTSSVWTWLLPVSGLFLGYLLVWRRRWSALLPAGAALRIGVLATLVLAALGFAVNDSGSVTIALMLVYVGPLVALLQLESEAMAGETRAAPRDRRSP